MKLVDAQDGLKQLRRRYLLMRLAEITLLALANFIDFFYRRQFFQSTIL